MIQNDAKTIVCYGDSNTWGQIPRTSRRYSRDIRWPSVLQHNLGEEYEVISEGLCGRTFVAVDPEKIYRSGITQLQSILDTSSPIEIIIIMLGTNDMKDTYNLDVKDIAKHLESTIQVIHHHKKESEKIPHILIICPPKVIAPEKDAISDAGKKLQASMVKAIDTSMFLADAYKKVADTYECGFIDAEQYIKSSKIDGYHLDEEGHTTLAKVVGEYIKKL